MSLTRCVVAALAAAALVVTPAPARADAVSGAQLRALAARAAGDPGALAQLRRVDRVDGRPVDLAGALRARGGALRARLRVLAAAAPAPAAGSPRAQAQAILGERRFRGSALPGPFHALLQRIGHLLDRLGRAFAWLNARIPGPGVVVWLVLAGLVGAGAAVVARRALTRRLRAAEAAAAAGAERDDAHTLERRAEAAEAAGDLEAALRLRFRAGLLRLDARGRIEFRPSLTTHEVRRTLRSEDFDALSSTFDDVVYGRRPPDGDDLAAARERWPKVVAGG